MSGNRIYLLAHAHTHTHTHDKSRNEEQKGGVAGEKRHVARYPNGILPGSVRGLKLVGKNERCIASDSYLPCREMIQTRLRLPLLLPRKRMGILSNPVCQIPLPAADFSCRRDMESRFARRKMYGAARFQVNANFPRRARRLRRRVIGTAV